MSASPSPLLQVENLTKYYPYQPGVLRSSRVWIKALDGVSFTIQPGEVLGLVGESGCGKTTLARSLVRLVEPTSGRILFQGENILERPVSLMKGVYRDMQMVFQDPYSSLHPKQMVIDLVGEGLRIHRLARKRELRDRVLEVLELVGLHQDHLYRFPHEFSGGQRQRIAIARALILRPKFLILDEPTSALDVSVQAQILNLLKRLRRELGLTYLFISHDLSVIEHMSDRVGVMYLGHLVELGKREALFRRPLHPYAQILLQAIPVPDPDRIPPRISLTGEVPSPIDPPAGCPFHPRCPLTVDRCREEIPRWQEIEAEHWVACHLATEGGKTG
ncbi:MAG: ABC transporter ATP-binding protein [Nitrospinota bacterium]|nr:MAG: ABC transporter ATP-binding protein [Nitrospinota bacterium]